MSMDESTFDALLDAYISQDATESQLEELRSAVIESPQFRERFQQEIRLNAILHETVVEQMELRSLLDPKDSDDRPQSRSPIMAPVLRVSNHLRVPLAAALTLLLVAFGYHLFRTTDDRQVVGVYMSLTGNVIIDRENTTRSAVGDDELLEADRIICDDTAKAMIRMTDGSILAMEPGSEMTLVSSSSAVRLEQGEVLFEVAERKQNEEPFLVETPQSHVSVLGTVFSLSCFDHTELKVYEGEVSLTRSRDNASVSVISQQRTSTKNRGLTVESMESERVSPTRVLTILPTDDVTLINGRIENNSYLKVEENRRVVYLRFEIPMVGGILDARLRLTQSVDTGSGTLRIHAGEHSRWSESTSEISQLPQKIRQLDLRSGVVERSSIVEFNLPRQDIGGIATFILSLDEGEEQDIWFASSQSQHPPQLVLTLASPNE